MSDTYEFAPPSYQNAVDLLPGWTSAFPPEANVSAGAAFLYEDPRIHWAIKQFGSLENKRILELGPLEGAHTSLLERNGALRIDAIEANKLAYLRCLVAKEIFALRRSRLATQPCSRPAGRGGPRLSHATTALTRLSHCAM